MQTLQKSLASHSHPHQLTSPISVLPLSPGSSLALFPFWVVTSMPNGLWKVSCCEQFPLHANLSEQCPQIKVCALLPPQGQNFSLVQTTNPLNPLHTPSRNTFGQTKGTLNCWLREWKNSTYIIFREKIPISLINRVGLFIVTWYNSGTLLTKPQSGISFSQFSALN